jgi:hypothetical protein
MISQLKAKGQIGYFIEKLLAKQDILSRRMIMILTVKNRSQQYAGTVYTTGDYLLVPPKKSCFPTPGLPPGASRPVALQAPSREAPGENIPSLINAPVFKQRFPEEATSILTQGAFLSVVTVFK